MKKLDTTILVIFAVTVFVSAVHAEISVDYTIDPGKGRSPISPYIYGTNFDYIKADNLAVRRIGGNRMTAYNWETNASNAGSDYIHLSNEYDTTCIPVKDWHIPGKMITDFVDQNLAMGAETLVTLQMAGYVAADKNGPVSEAEKAPSARWKQVVFKRSMTANNPCNPDPNDGFVYMDELVSCLISRYGNAATEHGIKFYAMDNEPGLWSHTHSRVHPQPVTCQEMIERTSQLASAVKDLDSHAEIFGGVMYGFNEFNSLQDAKDWPAAKKEGGYNWYIDYFLDQMKKKSELQNRRLLDVLTLHWYPEAKDSDGARVTEFKDTETNLTTRMQTPRSLWDQGYYEKSWVGEYFKSFLPLLPNVKKSIDQYYPGTKLAFTEYDYGGRDHVSGGIAQADLLGIFGKYGVYLATYFGVGTSGAYTDAAFKLYRDYDGRKSEFGDISVHALMSDKVNSSIYAAASSIKDDKLSLIVLNKNLTETINGTFKITSTQKFISGRVWAFDEKTSSIKEIIPIEINSGNSFTYNIPPLTACHIVLTSKVLAD